MRKSSAKPATAKHRTLAKCKPGDRVVFVVGRSEGSEGMFENFMVAFHAGRTTFVRLVEDSGEVNHVAGPYGYPSSTKVVHHEEHRTIVTESTPGSAQEGDPLFATATDDATPTPN